ncbi:MAG: hypothetical protein RLY31_1382 [Bacteroidota bacterium]
MSLLHLIRSAEFTPLLRLLLPTILCLLAPDAATQPSFPCDGHLYHVGGDGQHSFLVSIRRDTTSAAMPLLTTLADDLGHRITAIGYNVTDNLIYGLESDSRNLLRIHADGTVASLGVPPNLDPSLEYFAGTVRPQGGALLVIGREPGGNAKSLYTINLQPPYYAGLASIVSDEPVRITDMAFDPVFGSLFGFDEIRKRLVKVSSAGLVTSVNYSAQPQIKSLQSLFFDRWGNLYGVDYGEGQQKRLLLFNKFNGKVRRQFPGPAGSEGDGCSCPYQISLTKSASPAAVVPCGFVTLDYQFRNTAGIAYGQLQLTDTLPPAYVLTDMVKDLPASGSVNGWGSHLLDVSAMEVLLDTQSFSVLVQVGTDTGTQASHASVRTLPVGLGTVLRSDNPATLDPEDPTPITVAGSGMLITPAAPVLCQGGTRLLAAAGGGSTYTWNDGSNGPSLLVDRPGTYAVTVTGPCGTYHDTVEVVPAPPVWINLGEDRPVPAGLDTPVDFSSSDDGNSRFHWTLSGPGDLDCIHCRQPAVRLDGTALLKVVITDTNGCTATDDLVLHVRNAPPVFFPTAFSPNGDGTNDRFYPLTESRLPLPLFRISDRWGNIVFERKDGRTNEAADGWDGRYRGALAPPGLYRWEAEITLPSGTRARENGRVLLVF